MKKEEDKKTLFEDATEDVFLKSLKENSRPKTSKIKALEDYFYICSSQKKSKYIRYYFELYDSFIFCKKNHEKSELAFMDIKNSFLKKTKDTMVNDEPHFGLKFIKKKTYEEIFHKDEKVVDQWYQHLKRQCILTKFKCYFESIKVIGKGNFAKVFLVRRIVDKKEFAVKVFNKNVIMQDPVEKKCLIYEIEMMRLMSHYRVLRLHELYEGENFVYCLCELYEGTDLMNAIIKKGAQPEQKALTIILQILEGLHYMHNKNIMHRDIKPENIIFKKSTTIDIGIVDLGFATRESEFRNLFVRCGTPGYVAPEVLHDKDYNCKVDVFSTGIIFYIILTGHMPFKGNSYKEIVEKNMSGDINFDFKRYGVNISGLSKLTSKGSFNKNVVKGSR
jgi:tRNA A-37 threonylcarbamoyl transferase component Bud32